MPFQAHIDESISWKKIKILSFGICNSAEKNSQIGSEISEGISDPIDLSSIKQHGSSFPEKYIGNESVNLIITKFSDLFSKEEIKSELFAKRVCSFLILLFVEIFNRGNLILK